MFETTHPDDVPWDDPPSADEGVARLRLQLRGRSLVELEVAGLVFWDLDENIVRKGPFFEDIRPTLRSD